MENENDNLKIHDVVLYSNKDSYYIHVGYITKFTKSMIYINIIHSSITTTNLYNKDRNKYLYKITRRYKEGIIKINKDIFKELFPVKYNVYEQLKQNNEL